MRLVFLFSFSLLVLLAHGQECVWPNSFYFNHTETKTDYPDVTIPGWFALNLDYQGGSEAVYRSDGFYDFLCAPLGNNKHTDCIQLATEGWRYLILPTLGKCCKCCSYEQGCGPLGSFWVDGAVNGGTVNVAGTPSYHWIIKGQSSGSANSLYLAVNDSRVTEVTNGDTDDFIADMATYLNVPNDNLFAIPDNCDESCPSSIGFCSINTATNNKKKEDDLSSWEISRASTWAPSPKYKGADMAEASSVLNSHLDSNKELKTRSCSDWSLEELDQVQRWIASQAHPELLEIYAKAQDPRKMVEEDKELLWEKMREVAGESSIAEQLLVVGRCRETVMWYVHALSRKSQEEFIYHDLVLPRLPSTDEEAHVVEEELIGNEMWAYKMSSRMSSCGQCHLGSL